MVKKTSKKMNGTDAVQMASVEMGKIPPHAPEVEEAVLGAMMLDEECVYKAMESLSEKSFYNPKLRLVFASMTQLFLERNAIDLLTVTEKLRENGNLEIVGGASELAALTQCVGAGANMEYYVKILQQKTIQRALIEVGYGMLKNAFDETYQVDKLIEESQRGVFDAVQGNMRSKYVDLGNALNRALERLQWVQTTDGFTGIPSGFPSLDNITRGWQEGNLIVVGARPGHGKSAIALNMARSAAVDHNIPTAFFTLEMQDIELADRLMATETGLSSNKRKGREKMSPQDWIDLEAALARASKAPLFIDETPALTITEFTSKIKRMVHEQGIRVAFVDYLQLMNASSSSSSPNRALEIGEISRQLKETAKELHIPIIALAQLNRNITGRQGSSNGRPVLSDLKDSGSIEQDADIVLFIHRPALLGLSDDNGQAELIIAKNRAGEMGTINLSFNGDLVRFTESSKVFEYNEVPSAMNDSFC